VNEFIKRLPKAELHLHIEGTLEPEMVFELADKNDISLPFKSVEELRSAYHFDNLQSFLVLYNLCMGVLRTEQDFYDLTRAYLKKASQQNVRHTEMFFDPQAHTLHGIGFDIFMTGMRRAQVDSWREFGISSKLIMCFLRDMDEFQALDTYKDATLYRDFILGIGLDSAERGNPPRKFMTLFNIARSDGMHLVAHAGEEGPAAYILEALDLLKVERIDHGLSAITNDALVDRLVRDQIPLTMCPLSNFHLKVVFDLDLHPFKKMFDRGVMVTINSDDPAYFGGYINENYEAVQKAFNLSNMDLVQLAANSFKASFLEEQQIEYYLNDIDRYAESCKILGLKM